MSARRRGRNRSWRSSCASWAGVAATAGSPPNAHPHAGLTRGPRHGLGPRHRHPIEGRRWGRPCRSYSAAIARRARLAWVQGWAAPTPRSWSTTTRTGRGCAIARPFCPLCHANRGVSPGSGGGATQRALKRKIHKPLPARPPRTQGSRPGEAQAVRAWQANPLPAERPPARLP